MRNVILLLICAAACGEGDDREAARSPRTIIAPVEYDVVVAGAGTGGIGAAIQAARGGARVALLEESDWVGGQLAAAGVTSTDRGAFDPASGIYGELDATLRAMYAGRPLGTCYWGPDTVASEPHMARAALESLLAAEPSIDVFPRTRVVAVRSRVEPRTGHVTVTGLDVGTEGIKWSIDARVVIDATEYGDVLALSPARYRIGKSTSDAPNPDDCVQDITYLAVVRRYDDTTDPMPPELRLPGPPDPVTYPALVVRFAETVRPDGFDYPAHPWNWRSHAAYRGMPDSTNPDFYTAAGPPPNWERISRTGVNAANDAPYLASDLDPANRHAANCRAKMLTMQFLYYMQTNGQPAWSVANDEGYDGAWDFARDDCAELGPAFDPVERELPVIPYVREGRRLLGLHTLLATELFREPYAPPPPGGTAPMRARVHFPTSVAFGDYFVDLHGCYTDDTLDLGEKIATGLPGGTFGTMATGPFQIPFESLVPESVDGLLAGDKNVSASRLAEGALRLQPSTMNLGQGAGAIAAVATRHGIQPRQVPPVLAQEELVGQGATISLYQYDDVPRGSPHWAGVQLASTHELLTGDGVSTFFVDDAVPRWRSAILQATMRGLPLDRCREIFADVPRTHPGCREIEALYNAGLTGGCATAPLRYCPDDPIDRAQEAVGLVLGAGAEGSDYSLDPYFLDVPATHWAFRFVQIAFEKGYMGRCGDFGPMFCPETQPTTGEVADDAAATLLRKAEAGL